MPVVLGNGGLQGGIHRGQQIPQLIDEAGQHCPGVGRNQFVEPGRDHPPGALHHKLHQKRPGPQRQRAAGESHSGITGSASRAALIIALRRPIFSDSEPKKTPPMIEAML